MATGDGGLHIEPTMDIGGIRSSSKQMKQDILGVNNSVDNLGKTFDLLTKVTKEDIAKQKAYIKDLKDQYDELKKTLGNMPKGGAWAELYGELPALSSKIKRAESDLKKMEDAVDDNVEKHQSLRAQLRQVNQEMMELAANGQKDTQAYRDLQAKAVGLKKNMGLLTDELENMSSPTSGFQGVASGIAGVTGALAAANGIIGLFGGSSENLNKIMARTQSLMAITIGLQQVANTLYEGSAFRVNILAKAKALFTRTTKQAAAATVVETTAQTAETAAATTGTVATTGLAGAFKLLGAAIKKVPGFGWIIAGIAALTGIIGHFVSKAKEAAKAMEELRKNTAQLAVKPAADIELLSLRFKQLGDDMQAKQRFVKDNADAFKELGVEVNSVEDAERLLIENKDAFIKAQMEKARAVAAMSMAQDIMAKKLEAELKKESTPEKRRVVNPGDVNEMTGEYDESAVTWMTNKDFTKLENEIKGYDEKLKELYGIAAESEEAAVKTLEEAGIKAWKEYAEGTVGAIEQAISEKRKALKNVSSKEDYDKIAGEIEALQKKLETITGGNSGRPDQSQQTIFNISETVDKLNQKLEELQQLKERARKTGLVDKAELDKLEDEIKKLEDLVEKFKQLTDPGYIKIKPIKAGQLAVETNEITIKPRQIEVLPQSPMEGKLTWDNLMNDIKHYFEELDYSEVADNFGEIAHKIRDIGEAAGNADLKDFAEGLEEVSSLASTVIKGFQQGGWVAALINGIGWVASSLLEMAAEDAAVGKAIENSYLATALMKITDMMQSFSESDKWGAFFGADSLEDFNRDLQALRKTEQDLQDLNKSNNLSDYANFKKGYDIVAPDIAPSDRMMTYNDRWKLWNWFGFEDQTASLTDLAEMMGYKADDLYKDGKYNVEILQQILDTYPKLAAEDREWIEAAIELTDEYNEALEQMADYMSSLFGQVADTIADQMVDAFIESGEAAIDFGEVVSDVAKKMAKDLIKNMMYSFTFKRLEDEIMKVLEDKGGLNQDSAPIVLGLVQKAIGEMYDQLPYYQQVLEALAPYFDGSVAEEAALSGNLLQSASQDSVDMLNGQLNAVRTNQALMVSRVDSVILQLSGIYNEVRDFRGDSNRRLDQLIDNTSERGSIARAFGLA